MRIPNPPGGKNQAAEVWYEVPFETQKAAQDKAAEIPALDDAAYHGVAGVIARKVEDNSEADSRGVLGALLVGCGNVIGRTVHTRVNDTQHFGNEFLCLAGKTARARKGLATDIVEAILGLANSAWKERCVARNFSSGEGLINLVSDEVVKSKKKKGPQGKSVFESEVVREAAADKRKLCILPEFGELLTVMSREGNSLSSVLRQAWDSRPTMEINTKNNPLRASDAHISIIANITQGELLKLLPSVPNADGFANRFLWFLVRRLKYMPNGGPRVESYLVKEITRIREAINFARDLGEIRRSNAADQYWRGIYLGLSATADKERPVVERAEAHVLRLSTLYAVLDKKSEIEVEHIDAAYALWRYSEACALQIFGTEDLRREAQLVLDYLRSKGSQGATRTEIQNRVFHNNRTGAEIQSWLRALNERQLAWYTTEKNENGNTIERWYAVQYSGTEGPRAANQREKRAPAHPETIGQTASGEADENEGRNEFVTNSFELRTSQAFARANLQANSSNSSNSLDKSEKALATEENLFSLTNSTNSTNSCREAASVKDRAIRNSYEFVTNSCPCPEEKDQESPQKESKPLFHPPTGDAGQKPKPKKSATLSFPPTEGTLQKTIRAPSASESYIYARNELEIGAALSSLANVASYALDTETASDALRLVQLSDGENLPVILDTQNNTLKSLLVPFLFGNELIVQNARFDLHVFKNAWGVDIPIRHVFDTYIASALLTNIKVTEEEQKVRKRKAYRDRNPNKLSSIAHRVLGISLDKRFQDADWSVDLSLPQNEPMLAYAADDVRYLHAIRLHLEGEITHQGLGPVYELERDLIPCINQMGETGFCVDKRAIECFLADALQQTELRRVHLLEVLGADINPRSRYKQLLPALQALGLTVEGQPLYSTDKKVLPLIDQNEHPAVKAVLEWSAFNEEAKQLNQWLPLIDVENVVRPQINQFGAISGRFTYRKPNVQQVKKSALRSIILPPTGHLILRADFRTIELVLAAVYYKEEALLEQILQGVDLHRVTATILFHVPLEAVLPAQRDMAKTTNFSLLFGRSLEAFKRACRLAQIDMSEEEIGRVYRTWDDAWPGLAAYKAQIGQSLARRTHAKELRSMYGRRLILDDSLSARELRGALLNFPIQASGADVLKWTMLNIWQENPKWLQLLGSVHDELLAVIQPDHITQARTLLREAAADATRRVQKCDIPIQLEIGVGRNWWEAIQDKEEPSS
jgi:DNA polymerase I-like protein with 3'-5' exonuclease and polymerase domains